MGLFKKRRMPRSGKIELHVDDIVYDDWPIVADYTEISVAKAFCQQLRESGFAAEITSDWPLDQWGVGDIALRVHPDEDQFAARDLVDIAEEDGDELYPDGRPF
jgi:hypothetical protein